MAVAMILEWPGVTQAQYDQVIEAMDLGGKTAPGGYFHVAGPYEGGWRAVDVWESEDSSVTPTSCQHSVDGALRSGIAFKQPHASAQSIDGSSRR